MRINDTRRSVILHRLGQSRFQITHSLQNMKEQAFLNKNHLSVLNPSWNVEKDVRLISFVKLQNICDRVQFGLHILDKMMDDDWCQQNIVDGVGEFNEDYLLTLSIEYEKSLKYGFGISLFILIENCLRVMLRQIDPGACNGATTSFESVYQSLLSTNHLNLSSDEKRDVFELLNFIRLIRNLIHNDGVYFDSKGNNQNVAYRGMNYAFIHGQPINFVYWGLLLDLADHIQQLLNKLINHPLLISKVQILDPFEAKNP